MSTRPAVTSVTISLNPCNVGASIKISITVTEVEVQTYPIQIYVGTTYAGQQDKL